MMAGTLVYVVAEVDPPPDVRGPHTWKATSVVVEKASERQIKLKTPLQAIQYFLAARRLEIEALDRRRKEAERALAWATSQEGMSP